MRPVLLFSLLAACSDYDLAKGEPDPAPGADTGPVCPDTPPADYAPDATEPCEAEPIIGTFTPVVEWQWLADATYTSFSQVEVPPAVGSLTDDDGDGDIDGDDVPDVVFTAFKEDDYTGSGIVVALSGADGAPLWSVKNEYPVQPWGLAAPLLADLHGTGDPTVIVAGSGGLLALDHAGALRWTTAATTQYAGFSAPAAGDVDADGVAEVLLGAQLFDADGTPLWAAADDNGERYNGSFIADLDQDGLGEVVTGWTVFAHDGTVVWQNETTKGGWPAVGDFDGDGDPELVSADRDGFLWLLDALTGALLWEVDLPEGGGGPPTVADFDGDGVPEIGLANMYYYRVYEGDGTLVWEMPTEETSSGFTGSSVFDFEGDGAAEVVYADEETLWIFDGGSGTVELAYTDHNSGTRFEYPTIADIDRDGSAEILCGQGRGDNAGLTVVGDADGSWVAARPVWNQHAYHITNVEDDLGVPATPTASWTSWNSFRAANSETRVGLALPDLKPGAPQSCAYACDEDRVTVWIPVENGGTVTTAATSVAVYRVDGGLRTLVTEAAVPALAGASMTWVGPIELEVDRFGSEGLVVVVDPSADGGTVEECLEDNNEATLGPNPCG